MADDTDQGDQSYSGIFSKFLRRTVSVGTAIDTPEDQNNTEDEASREEARLRACTVAGDTRDYKGDDKSEYQGPFPMRRRTLSAMLLGPRAEMLMRQQSESAVTSLEGGDGDEDIESADALQNTVGRDHGETHPESERLFDSLLKKINSAAEGFMKPSQSSEGYQSVHSLDSAYSDDLLMDRICRRLDGKKD